MRGKAARPAIMLTAVTPDSLAPRRHLMRRIKPLVDQALVKLSRTFDRMYAAKGAGVPCWRSWSGSGGSGCCRRSTAPRTVRCRGCGRR